MAIRPPGVIGVGAFPNCPVVGTSSGATGVTGSSNFGIGVTGQSTGEPWVSGSPPASDGVLGEGKNGVHGLSSSSNDSGVWGENRGGGYGVSGSTSSQGTAGVWGHNAGAGLGVKATSAQGYGLWANGKVAGHFEGDVEINGNLTCTGDCQLLVPQQDCAEDFEMSGAEEIGPGSVVVIDSVGAMKQSDKAYDRRVAGVISGALDCRPGIILGKKQVQDNRMPVALVGKVYCKVDAGYSPVEVGDLLTTSPTPGHAMKADDPFKAFGAVIGKAMDSLKAGQALIPILVALQ